MKKTLPFIRLMKQVPADVSLYHFDQCVKEIGNIWFFYSCFLKDIPLLTLSLNVPRPGKEDDEAALDTAVQSIVDSLKSSSMPPTRCDWKEMGGPLAWRLYLEFDWNTVDRVLIARMQDELFNAIRNFHADNVRHYFRGSGARHIYYSELVGNVITRSLDMADAFDIRKYSFKEEGSLEYKEDNECPVPAEEFEELFEAAKPDIDFRGLSFRKLRLFFNKLYLDEVILSLPVLRGGWWKKRLEAWYQDKETVWQNWNIVHSDRVWWVYSVEDGELGDIFQMSDEEQACDLFVRYVVEGLQNAEDNEG